MSPVALRNALLAKAAELLELPHEVRVDLLRTLRRQDKAAYDVLRRMIAEVNRELRYDAGVPRLTWPAGNDYCVEGFDPR